MNKKGLYQKYLVTYADRKPLDPGPVFVLRPDRDPAAWHALVIYSYHTRNNTLAQNLHDLLWTEIGHPLKWKKARQ